MYKIDTGSSQFADQSADQYRDAAENCDVAAKFALAVIYEGNDAQQALVWFRKAADQGHAEAQFHLGWRYDRGDGVTRDVAAAVGWYARAAEQGFAPALFRLGLRYDFGADSLLPRRLLDLYLKAAERGNDEAQFLCR